MAQTQKRAEDESPGTASAEVVPEASVPSEAAPAPTSRSRGRRGRPGRWLGIGLIAALLLGTLALPGAAADTREYRIYLAASGQTFNPVGWMVEQLARRLWGRPGAGGSAAASPDGVALVRRYLESRQVDDPLRAEAERILQQQIAASLADLGLAWPTPGAGQTLVFPPVQFAFVSLPDVLVVSRRDRIERIGAQTLLGTITDAQAAEIERAADAEGVSTLVVKIGGLGVYPSMIPKDNNLTWLLPTLAHEWAHQYFTLQPVGWRYALDVERDPNMIILNETAAEMIGDEVGWHALATFYGLQRPEPAPTPAPGAAPANDRASAFNRRMRALRERVDALLAEGKVAEAEAAMEEERQRLNADGYRIRKLNQAYFAFYGSYASAPGFVSPIGGQLKALRARSGSLRDFAATVAGFSSPADLTRALGE